MLNKIFGIGFKKQAKQDKIFDIINYLVLFFILLIVLYPLYFIIIASFSSPDAVSRGDVWLYPIGFSLEGYEQIFKYKDIWMGYKNSIIYTVLGTSINILILMPAAFAISRKELVGRGLVMGLFTFTMFFGGGLIPTYLLIESLNMYNTVWALVLPGAVGVYNLIVVRAFFSQTIPEELFEAASIDGCSYFRYFRSVVLPVAKPVIAVMVLIHAVGHWNSYFNALIYLSDREKYPLQVILREILIQQQSVSSGGIIDPAAVERQRQLAELIKYGVIIVSTLPVLIMYPFLQKYFVQGMMIGSVKG